MTTVGFATLDVIPSLKGTRTSLEQQVAGDFAALGKTGGAKFGDAAGREAGGRFKAGFGKFAKSAFAPVAGVLAGAAVVNIFKDAIQGASDLQESGSKVNVVFGDAADSVRKFAADAATGLGQSEAQALEATGTFGNLLRSVGLAEADAAEFSTTMVGLASDLASFNNTSVDDAILALRAGLVGETEPLKRFGVNLNEATLKAKALELGLGDGKAVLDSNAKAQAAYALIMEQTSLAQGDFARTSDGLANQQKILGAQWTEMKTGLGQALLPVITGFVSFLNEDGIPTLQTAGGVVGDLAKGFGDLPPPVKAAALAFIALNVATRAGLGDHLDSGINRAATSISGLRQRTALATDSYRELRSASIQAEAQGFKFNQGSGRIVSGLGAVKTAAAGAGGALKAGLGGALGLIGGPWGAAFIAGTAVLTHFWQENQKSKARVEELTASLDEQTGAVTDLTKAQVFKNLQESGAIDLANELGVSLTDLRDAALGSATAQERVNAQLDASKGAYLGSLDAGARAGVAGSDFESKADDLRRAIGGQSDELDRSTEAFKDQAEFMGKGADEQENLTVKVRDYDKALTRAKDALRDLIDAEQTRADNAVRQRRDQLGLITTIRDAEKEARKGKQTLDENTAAGRNNLGALLDLADQWNNSSPKVQNARGAYADLRNEFIKLADQMNGPHGTRKDAILLADSLLKVPKNVPVRFQSTGFRERMNEIAALKLAAQGITSTVDFDPLRPEHRSPSTPTSTSSRTATTGGVTFNGPINVTANDPNALLTELQRRRHRASSDGIRR